MTHYLDRRRFLAGALGAAGAATLAACSSGNSSSGGGGGHPTVRMAGGPVGFPSPFAYNSGLGYYQMSLLYDTLLWKDSTGTLLPWLASGYKRSSDGMTYTFQLRKGLKWSDGKPLTADDVAFTFSYFAKHTLPPLVIAQPRGVAKAVAKGPHTVEIRLQAPMVTFPAFVAGAVPIVPKHIWSQIKDPIKARDTKVLVGSGAYRLQSFGGPDKPLAYQARNDYYLGKPYVGRIEMVPVGDTLAALQSGNIGAGGNFELGGTRPQVLQPFSSNSDFGIAKQAADSVYPLYFNLAKGGALADVNFRRACAYAINRDDLVQRLTGGNGAPGNPGFLPPEHPYHVGVEQYAHDAGKANTMLDKAGYKRGGGGTRTGPGGKPLSFQLLVATPLTSAAQLIAGNLRSVGIDVKPQAMQLGPQIFGAKLSGNFDLALLPYPGPGGTPPISDPDQLRQIYSSKMPPTPTGAAGYKNATFDQLAQRQLITIDTSQRHQIVGQMQHIIAGDLPVLPLYYSTSYYVFRKSGFDQWYYTPGGFPVGVVNKQAFITGKKTGTQPRTR